MQSSHHPFSKQPLALAMAVLALCLATPASAQESTPGWLGWGGDASESRQEQAPEREVAQTGSVADQGVPESRSGQAALLQRLMRRVDSLESEVRELRGQQSEQQRALEQLRQEHARALRQLEARGPAMAPAPANAAGSGADGMDATGSIDSGAQGLDATGSTGEAPQPAESAQAAAASSQAVSDEQQQALYNQAFETLKSGKYEQAVAAFQKVIDANPQGAWAPSAFFWQGETHYVQRDYNAAAKSYAELIERYPESNRVPDATLKLGYIAQEQDRLEDARARFNTVIEQYPDSQAAGLARQRLDRLGE